MPKTTDKTLLELSDLRKSLKKLIKPEVLNHIVDFLDNTGGDKSMIERYDWFCHNSEHGGDCKYARIAKEIFLKDEAKSVAKTIIWLYNNWARFYKEN